MNFTDLRKNAEGYDDPTAYEAIMRADEDLKHRREEEIKKEMEEDFKSRERVCPICEKKFLVAPEHSWIIGDHTQTFKINGVTHRYPKKVCSYSCMRKWEKANGREK